jgi:ADP-ribosylglycohydrolase
LFSWAEGCGGVERNGRVVEARLPERLTAEQVVLVSSSAERAVEANLAFVAPARCRTLPSIAHRLAVVAAGEAAATTSIFSPCSWDYGAGHALVRGAGGFLVGSDGVELGYAADGTSHTPTAFAGSSGVATMLAGRTWVTKESERRVVAGWPVRLRRGETVREAGLLARAQGCLLGQVAGDSLGSLVEFQSAAAIAHRYPDGPRQLADGGTFDTLAGQATDDSELALALARAIVASGTFSEGEALAGYRRWLASSPFDVGHTIRAALENRPNIQSQANGSLMRVSPLAIFAHAREPRAAAALAHLDASLTHPHPVCRDSTAAFVVAVAHTIRHGDGPEAAYRAALGWARAAGAEAAVIGALEQAATGPPVDCDGASQGWVLIALRNAFHELLHASSLEEGVVRTVRRGGDTDTNAAIAGALLGAAHGREAVPAQWRQMVLSCRPLAGQAGVRKPRPEVYWPVDVMELAERLLIAGRG